MKKIFDPKYPITKMHGTGNDFVVYVDFDELTTPDDVRKICDRHFGIGADGVLAVAKSRVKEAKYRMRYSNSDGSTAEMCGNGIRCFVKYLVDNGLVQSKGEIAVDTDSGIIVTEILTNSNDEAMVKVNMGKPVFKNPKQISPLADKKGVVRIEISVVNPENGKKEKLEGLYVGMGNPHGVFFVKKGQSEKYASIYGAQIESNTKIFPQKANIEFVEVDSKKDLTMHVWERGAGLTLSCGTGTCAAFVAAVINGESEKSAKVHVPGGELDLAWDGIGLDVFMTGPAVNVFSIKNLNL